MNKAQFYQTLVFCRTEIGNVKLGALMIRKCFESKGKRLSCICNCIIATIRHISQVIENIKNISRYIIFKVYNYDFNTVDLNSSIKR